jgi:hypothetical protein
MTGEAGASNYPLRGGKYSLFEGGIRSNSFVSGGFVPAAVRNTTQVAAITLRPQNWNTSCVFCTRIAPCATQCLGSARHPLVWQPGPPVAHNVCAAQLQLQHGVMHISDWWSTFCAVAGIDPTDTQVRKKARSGECSLLKV